MKLFGSRFLITRHRRQTDVHATQKNIYGYIDSTKKRIRLWNPPGIHKDTLLQTYIHELVHAICWHQSIEIGEQKTELLAVGLTSWILENGIKVKIG